MAGPFLAGKGVFTTRPPETWLLVPQTPSALPEGIRMRPHMEVSPSVSSALLILGKSKLSSRRGRRPTTQAAMLAGPGSCPCVLGNAYSSLVAMPLK